MKKFLNLTVALLSLTLCLPAGASQWSQNPMENLLVSGADDINQDYPLTCACPDGSTYVGWISWEDETACLKLQLIDKDGDMKFGDGGIYISRYPTPTWTSGFDIVSDKDGNAIIVYSDRRNDVWQAYAYKVSPSGEMLWNDGVALASNNVESCLNPKLIISDAGNIIIGYQALTNSRNSIKVTKLTPDGSKAWGGHIEITGANGLFAMAPSNQDSFLVTWFQADRGNLAVMRYTANGEEAWNGPTIVDEGSAVVSTEPLACSDGKGGIVVSWRHSLYSTQVDGRLQNVDRDGKLLWAESIAFSNVPQICTDNDNNIVAAYTTGKDNQDNIFMSKYDTDGDCVWASRELLESPSYRIAIYGVSCINGEAVAVYRNILGLRMATIDYIHLDTEGYPVDMAGKVSAMDGDKGFGRLASDGTGQMVLAWSDNGSNRNGGRIYAQNILPKVASVDRISVDEASHFHPVYIDGVIKYRASAEQESRITVYDMSGRRIASCGAVLNAEGYAEGHTGYLAAGVYIVKCGSKSAKIIINH
ncbi:MAG: T9SS type A sorting domain-containing protein [Muribaculaceae bacterium]|nr:T9SS type A sorting domain-containing protein [Muribaculaceae bacterium]